MIGSYSEYIRRYLLPAKRGEAISPGEHHFVAAYLIPKLFALNQRVPDFINPDGTKGLNGDVIYLRNGKPELAIEIKLDVIRLTRSEFNDWIVALDEAKWPQVFLGVGTSGIGLIHWRMFRSTYISSVRSPVPNWAATPLTGNRYGPMKSINDFLPRVDKTCFFPFSENPGMDEALERRFEKALRVVLPSNLPLEPTAAPRESK